MYVGIDDSTLDKKDIGDVKTAFQQFRESVKNEFGLEVEVNIKSDRAKSDKMPHARYIVTDQVSVLIERGFDLLWDDATMTRKKLDPTCHTRKCKDTHLVCCDVAVKMRDELRRLNSL